MNKSRLSMLLSALALCAIALFAVAGCGGDDDDNDAGGGGTLTVGSDIPYPPFEQGKAPNYTGFDIEVVEAIADSIGREAQFQDTSFETIFRDLAQGKFEMVASASTITPEREKTVDFTDPYYLSEQALLVESGSEIASVEDLDGTTVGVQQGTTGEELADEETGADEVRAFPGGPDAITALKAGTVDAVVIDLPVADNAVENGEGIEVATSIPTEEEYGFAIAQDEEDLLAELNEGLKEIKDDGTYARIYRKWFHRDPPEEIFDATHEPS
jgi:polar amino acid transport system substrate-binding protein